MASILSQMPIPTPPPLVRQTRVWCACGMCVSEYGHLACYRCAVEGTPEHAYHMANGVYAQGGTMQRGESVWGEVREVREVRE